MLSGDPGDPMLEPILYFYSNDDLKDIKRLWTSYLLSLAKTLGVDCPTLSLEDSDIGKTVKIDGEERKINLADVRYSYTKITAETKGNLYHGLFYQNRDYLIDFAKYSNQHPDCNIPDDLFLSYSNCGRSYGLFRKLKALEDCMRKRKEKETENNLINKEQLSDILEKLRPGVHQEKDYFLHSYIFTREEIITYNETFLIIHPYKSNFGDTVFF